MTEQPPTSPLAAAQKCARDAWHACYQEHNHDKARVLFEAAANAFRKLGQDWELLKVLRGLAHAQGNLGDTEGALRTLTAIVRHIRRLPLARYPSQQQRNEFLCKVYHNISLAYNKKKDWRRALRTATLAVRYLQRSGSTSAHLDGLLHLTIGRALICLNRHSDALQRVNHAIQIFRTENNHYHQAVCHEYTGEILLERGDLDHALAALDQAVHLMRTAGNPRPSTWRLRGIVCERLGRLTDARDDFTRAINLMEDRRNAITLGRYRVTYVGAHVDTYNAAIRNAIALGEFERAYDYVQRAKSRHFNESLEYRLPTLSLKDHAAYQRLCAARYALDVALNGADNDGATLAKLRRAQREYDSILHHIQQRHEELHRALGECLAAPSLTLADIRALLHDGDALLEYYYDNSRLHLFVITRDTFTHTAVPNAHGEIGRLQRGIRDTMAALETCRPTRINHVRERYRWYLNHAAQRLLAPVQNHLAGIRRLFIIPHRKLHYIPFAALPTPDGADLLDTCEIHYAFSPRMIAACRARPSQLRGMFMIIVNPLGDLPNATAEGRALAALTERAHLFVGRTASHPVLESHFRSASQQKLSIKYLHFACHAVVNPHHPLQSALILSDSHGAESRLRVGDIITYSFSTDLVTLNCCDSAIGDATPGDEATCFTRAFLRAGARNVLACLWKIDDQSSSDIILDFYRGIINDGLDKAAALRRAQLNAKRAGLGPYHWAAYQLVGE